MTLPEEQTRILVIDDEEQIRRALKSLLTVRKYQVLLAENGQQGLELAPPSTRPISSSST